MMLELQTAQALYLAVIISAAPLSACLIVGFLSSLFQAATQIQDQALSFVPKLAAVGTIIFILGPWFSTELCGYSTDIFLSLQNGSGAAAGRR